MARPQPRGVETLRIALARSGLDLPVEPAVARGTAWLRCALPRVAAVAVPSSVFALHAFAFGGWLIDDAGISLAYARSLAEGHGLVAQAGAEAVEGFSNPLWTLLLALLYRLGLMALPVTPKLLAGACVAAAFALMAGRGRAVWSALPALLLSLTTPFVVWCASGLENALLALLVVAAARVTLDAHRAANARDVAAGLLSAALALTRPDGLIFAAAYPLVVLARREQSPVQVAWRWLRFGLAFVAAFGPYLAFRLAFYRDWLPNTFHAKVTSGAMELSPSRWFELGVVTLGWLAVPVTILLIWSAWRDDASRSDRRVLLLHLALAGLAFLILPPDWMGEYRFATPLFVFLFWSVGRALAAVAQVGVATRRAALVFALLLVGQVARLHVGRTLAFAAQPVVPLERIAEFGRGYDTLANELPGAAHSLMAPDLGGTLLEARLRVFDLAGLCDRTVARTLTRDRRGFHDYVFETARPTFIHVHGSWAGWAGLHTDARFARDYAPLFENWIHPSGSEDPGEAEPWHGDYVRRDALPSSDVEPLRRRFVVLGLARPLP